MKKNIIGTIIAVVLIWLLHGLLLIRVSNLETAINRDKKQLEILEKELNAKIIEYDSKVDLEKIGKEMKVKKNMKIANNDDFHFFEIEKQ